MTVNVLMLLALMLIALLTVAVLQWRAGKVAGHRPVAPAPHRHVAG
ncbi:hypothetical protein [Rhodococcus yananensis]|nr:hypothetical protein [Rhodococcus yananensis]